MENLSKALLIAAGIFIAILIISVLVVVYNNFSSYYASKHDAAMIEQTAKFNAQFEKYHKNGIRGSDLISCMNKIINYNATESYFEDTNYERIKVKITLAQPSNENDILGQFRYSTDKETGRNEFLLRVITNESALGNDWENDKKLIEITNTPSAACELAKSNGLTNISDTKLQQLASKISDIFVDEDDNSKMAIYNRIYRAELLEDLLGKDIIKVAQETGKIRNSDTVSKNRLQTIKQVTSQYYQYMQFKRARFDCTKITYDPDTDRIIEMEFKLQTKTENGVETPVFD